MNYYAENFMFDGVPSQKYGLFLCSIGKSGGSESGGGSVSLFTDRATFSTNNYLLGVDHDEVMSFNIVIGSRTQLSRVDLGLIQSWLFTSNKYKKLQIIQSDMSTVYFNCILNEPKIISFGNVPQAIECKVICDRPWALDLPRTYNYRLTNGVAEILHNNTSQDGGILLPTISFVTNKSNANIKITNVTNNNYVTQFSGLSNNETITIDAQSKIITSSISLKRLDNFNKVWFELVPNMNKIKIEGDTALLSITYQNARRVGA